MTNPNAWIGYEFDGVVATIPADNTTILGKPIKKTIEQIESQLTLGFKIRIVTPRVARVTDSAEWSKNIIRVREWVNYHILSGWNIPLTNLVDADMKTLYHRAGVGMLSNTGEMTCTAISNAYEAQILDLTTKLENLRASIDSQSSIRATNNEVTLRAIEAALHRREKALGLTSDSAVYNGAGG